MRSNLGFVTPAPLASFSPLSISGLAVWYDASDAATITDTGGLVDSWADKSGNSRTLTGTLTARPTTGTRTQNSLNVLDFDGSNDYLGASSAFTQGTSDTVFIVCLNDDGADATTQFSYMADSATSHTRLGKASTNAWRINSGATLDGGTPNTSAHLMVGVFNGASSELRLDGASLTSGDAGSNSTSLAPHVGRNRNGSQYWDGWIAEILHYDSVLSAGNIALVEGYLLTKWAI